MPRPQPRHHRRPNDPTPPADNSLREALERIQQSRATWAARARRGLATDPFEELPDPDASGDELRDALLRLWLMRVTAEGADSEMRSRCGACRKPLDSNMVVIDLSAETVIALGGDPGVELTRQYIFCTGCAEHARDLLDWLEREGGSRR